MTAASLLTRVDASLTMGTGHVMRCIALAQAWQDACGSATFVMAESTPGIQARLAQESCELLSISCAAGSEDDALEAIRLARGRQVEWIVVDGYQFGADYQRTLKAAGFKVLLRRSSAESK
jgi:UDP-2,4-diacetamido-2,4,6-trideoxy-beta-L-altropyranose hydrolase